MIKNGVIRSTVFVLHSATSFFRNHGVKELLKIVSTKRMLREISGTISSLENNREEVRTERCFLHMRFDIKELSPVSYRDTAACSEP